MTYDYFAESVQRLVGEDIDENILESLYRKGMTPEEAADHLYQGLTA